ncbi:beta-lactoglobulin-2-like [Odocoileus virginianus]|uniref:Beta-lactoglobulin-2-like n=1 Tax=Odocoileus virginianus TaxID=9874 RepID=A0ABM4IMA4_ODOVR
MKCLLLALGLALACGVQAAHIPQTAEDLDVRKVVGTWHVVAMVASDMSLLDAESGPLRVYVEELKPTPQGDLEVMLQKRENHEYVEKTLMALKTEDTAVFTVDCHGERKISVLDTDYSSYMILCMEGPTPTDEGSVMCQCLARTSEVDDEVMEKFDGALASLPEHMQMVLDLRQGAGLRKPYLLDTAVPSAGSDLSLSKRLTPEVFLALAASLDSEPRHHPADFWGLPGTVQAQRGPSCLASDGRRPSIVLVAEAPGGPEDGPRGNSGNRVAGGLA